MATVVANTAFKGYLKRDELGPRPKVTTGPNKGKPAGEDEGYADGLPSTNAYGDLTQEVKEGETVSVFLGQMFEDSHPAVKKWPSLFSKPDAVGSPKPAEK